MSQVSLDVREIRAKPADEVEPRLRAALALPAEVIKHVTVQEVEWLEYLSEQLRETPVDMEKAMVLITARQTYFTAKEMTSVAQAKTVFDCNRTCSSSAIAKQATLSKEIQTRLLMGKASHTTVTETGGVSGSVVQSNSYDASKPCLACGVIGHQPYHCPDAALRKAYYDKKHGRPSQPFTNYSTTSVGQPAPQAASAAK
jgi:hypothetical protein